MKLTIRLLLCVTFILSGILRPAFITEAAEAASPGGQSSRQGGVRSEGLKWRGERARGSIGLPSSRRFPASEGDSSDPDSPPAPTAAPNKSADPARNVSGAKPSAARAIEISSPSEDYTAHTSQYELQINVNDEDIDDLLVAVYTPASGGKPSSARVLTVKRSDKGKKSVVIALAEGANRIEVTDLKRSELKEVRTITYEPEPYVLNSVASRDGEYAPPRPAATPIGGDRAVICGQIQLASLDRTLAFIKTTPELGDIAARFRPPDDPRQKFADALRAQKKAPSAAPEATDRGRPNYLIMSTLDDTCKENEKVTQDGLQRSAVVDVLKATLMRLDNNLRAKDTPINDIALRRERTYILQSTTIDPDIEAAVNDVQDKNVTRKGERHEGPYPTEELRPQRGSGFSALSPLALRKQIALLEQYLGNVEVQLRDKEGKVVDRAVTDRDGNFKFVVHMTDGGHPPEQAGAGGDCGNLQFTVTTDADDQHMERKVCPVAGEGRRVNIVIDDRPVSLLTRAIVGLEQSGAAAAEADQNYFFDVFVSGTFPFKQRINPDFGEALRLWGDFRIASVPQAQIGDLTVGGLATGFTTQISGLHVKDVAHVFEFLGGLEYRLTGNNALLPSFDRWTKQKFSISLIGAFGTTTPLNPLENITTFKVSPDAPGLPPEAKGKEFISFVRSDRDRFFRQYYGGVRVQTFFFSPYNIPTQRFPTQLDLTIGQNEFVTGGRFRGPVLRMEGFFPLPYERLRFINLFATAMIKPGHTNIGPPLVLQPAPEGTVVPASNVLLVALPQPNRDYYRIGFGIDLISFVQKFRAITASPGK